MDFMYANNNGETKKISVPASSEHVLKSDWFNQEFGNEWELPDVNTNLTVINQIRQIELNQERAVREAILYGDKSRLELYEQQIISLRNQLA